MFTNRSLDPDCSSGSDGVFAVTKLNIHLGLGQIRDARVVGTIEQGAEDAEEEEAQDGLDHLATIRGGGVGTFG